MIVYNDIKRQFIRNVEDYSIADKSQDAIKTSGLYNGNMKEYLPGRIQYSSCVRL